MNAELTNADVTTNSEETPKVPTNKKIKKKKSNIKKRTDLKVPNFLGRLLKNIQRRSDGPSVIKTAIEFGYLADSGWVTKLDNEEIKYLKLTNRIKESVVPKEDPTLQFPPLIGSAVVDIREKGNVAVAVDSGGKEYEVHPYLTTIQRRHKWTTIHFDVDKKVGVYFSSGMKIVAFAAMITKEDAT